MKTYTYVPVFIIVLALAACSGSKKSNVKGEWYSKNKQSLLKITDKQFTIDTDPTEDYFLKGDTIFTSFQGNLPYTKFVVKQLDEHSLKLLYPDSTVVEFSK